MPVDFAEEPGSPQESWDKDGLTAVVHLRCDWNVRNQLIIEKLMWGGELYPRLPISRARARSGSAAPAPGQLTQAIPGYAQYENAIVTINYSTKGPDKEDEGVLFEESIEPTAEFMTLDHTAFAWGAADGPALKEQEAPGLLQPGCDLRLTFPDLTTIPAAVMTLPGYVNAAAYTSRRGIVFPAETLLFNLPVIHDIVKADGTNSQSMDLRLTYKPCGWNRFWHAASGAYLYQYFKTGGIHRGYPMGNFSAIFA